MALTVPTREPESVRVGDTLKFTKSLPDFDPAADTLNYSFVNASNIYTVTATDNGDGNFLINVLPATTAAWAAGSYRWAAQVTTAGGEKHTVESGTINILPDLMSAAVDDRSHVKKVLDALEAVIENKATKDQLSYSIGGRSISLMSTSDILLFRDRYKAEYQAEQRAERIKRGLGHGGKIKVRFQ